MTKPERDESNNARVEVVSAVTLATGDMRRAVAFYTSLGFEVEYGGPDAAFTTLTAGSACLNLTTEERGEHWMGWGRIIFYVNDVDAFYSRVVGNGMQADTQPADAAWGERYFHLTDPDGHQLSFARPLDSV